MPKADAQPHSAPYLDNQRFDWWNLDYLQFLIETQNLPPQAQVLDVGSGQGHWTEALAAVMPSAKFTGIDSEAAWVQAAQDRAVSAGLSQQIEYQVGHAEKLQFEANQFDLVTCQTVLIHVPDHRAVLTEMKRVLRPAGKLLLIEPNNQANVLMTDNVTHYLEPKTAADLVLLFNTCQKGKRQLGEGDISVGDLLPGHLNDLGFTEIKARMNDQTMTVFPPYPNAVQQRRIDQTLQWAQRGDWVWAKPDAERYFLAGGGSKSQFEPLWQQRIQISQDIAKSIKNQTYHTTGGFTLYAISATKPIDS